MPLSYWLRIAPIGMPLSYWLRMPPIGMPLSYWLRMPPIGMPLSYWLRIAPGSIHNACQLESAGILMLEYVKKLQHFEACLHLCTNSSWHVL